MMIKSTKRNKRLTVMVGAALSFSLAYGIAPGDALAADYKIFYDDTTDNEWKISQDGVVTTFNAGAYGSLSLNAPGTTDVLTIICDSSDSNGLATIIDSGIALGDGDQLIIKDADGDSANTLFSMTAGSDSDTVTYDNTSGSKFTLDGTPSNVDVDVADAELDLSTATSAGTVTANKNTTITAAGGGSTIANLTVADGATVTNAGGTTTITDLNLNGTATVNGGAGAGVTVSNKVNVASGTASFGEGVTLTGGLGIAEGATVHITDDVTSGAVTGAGTLSIDNGKTLTSNAAIDFGGTVTLGNNSSGITSTGGITVGGITANGGNIDATSIESTGGDMDLSNATLTNVTSVKSSGDVTLTGATLSSVTSVEAGGDVTLDDVTGSLTSVKGDNITLNNAATIAAGTKLDVGTGGTITADAGLDLSAADNVTAGTIRVTGGSFMPPNDTTLLGSGSTVEITGATLPSTLNIGAATLDVNGVTATGSSNGGLGTATDVTAGTVKLNADGATIGGGTTLHADNVESTGTITVTDGSALKASDGTGAANVKAAGFDTTGASAAIEVGALEITGAAGLTATEATAPLTAGSVTLASGASVAPGSAVTTDTLKLDASGGVAAVNSQLDSLTVTPATPGSPVDVQVDGYDALSDTDKQTLQDKLDASIGAGNYTVGAAPVAPTPPASASSADVMNDIKAVAGDEVAALVAANAAVVAAADPFETKLPSADALAKLNALGNVNGEDLVKKYYDAVVAEGGDVTGLSPDAKTQAARLTSAVQQAGKTAAAPGATSARTAGAITNVLRDNVVNRNAEIRDFALEAAVDDGRPALDRVWFQYKHTNMDVDGDVYDESNVNINTFQLGYDAKLGANDYLGVFVGTTTGDSEFKGPKRSGRMDIDGAFDVGVYGTHMLPAGQYIDYMVHTGSFDSKYAGDKWVTTDTGAMVGYGLKIASGDRLTMNPYVQLAYDKISVDDYITGAGGNRISSDDSDNWTAKLGMNIIDASGLYGGLAYSRGLSGSYNAYINGVPMPTSDYNANVLYLSLGYRANMSKNAVFDLSMEKTFLDYDGWTASGKLNFYF